MAITDGALNLFQSCLRCAPSKRKSELACQSAAISLRRSVDGSARPYAPAYRIGSYDEGGNGGGGSGELPASLCDLSNASSLFNFDFQKS